MSNRMKLKTRKFSFAIKLRDKIAIIFLLVCFVVLVIFKLINSKVTPILVNYAEVETERIAMAVINKSILSFSDDDRLEELVLTTVNDENEIISVDFNTSVVNSILYDITNSIEQDLILLDNGKLDELDIPISNVYEKDNVSGIVYYIPFGVVTGSSVIADIGPKIPVKNKLVGAVYSNVKTDVIEYGINNAIVKIYVEVEVNEQVILPFLSKKVTVKSDIPVLVKMVQGKIPSVYGGMFSTTSPLVSS